MDNSSRFHQTTRWNSRSIMRWIFYPCPCVLTCRFVISDYVTLHYWTEMMCQKWKVKVITKDHCREGIWIHIRLFKQVCHRNESTPTIYSIEKWNSKYIMSNWKLLGISNWINLFFCGYIIASYTEIYVIYITIFCRVAWLALGNRLIAPGSLKKYGWYLPTTKHERNTTRREPCA